jgi:uncharacterized protein
VTAVVVIAKSPEPGKVKTRLCPPLTAEQAATVAEAALRDTLVAVAASATRCVVALEGEAGPWLPDEFEVVPQGHGSLGERLAFVFAQVGAPAVVIAMDTPQVTSGLLREACDRVTTHDVVLGPTDDGGYWLVGTSAPQPALFDGVPMSVPSTYTDQLAQIAALGLTVAELPQLRDVDDWDDALAVAAGIPHHHFGRAVAALR